MRSFYRFCTRVFVWYFIASGINGAPPETQGPFPNEQTCVKIRNFVRVYNLTPCWSVGQDNPENTESRIQADFQETESDLPTN